MNYYSNQKKEEPDLLIKIMNFIQWSFYKGGVSLIFISGGVFVLIVIAVLSQMGMKLNYIALSIGIALTLIGLLIYMTKRRL